MPTLAELDTAMLQPGRAVPAVSRLGGGAIAMAAPAQPWRLVGRNAAIYQLRHPSGETVALRCFLGDEAALDPRLGDRYRAFGVAPALAPLQVAGGPLVTDTLYMTDGITLPAADFRSVARPLIAMEWVSGSTLLTAVDRACQAEDTAALDEIARAWARAIVALEAVGFSHGELNADNAMVRPDGTVTLVDYDTCAWPGSPAPPGTTPPPGYAQPAAKPPATIRRDRFPALVVYTSLRLLAAWPRLREQYGDSPDRAAGVLLFAARDLDDPDQSALVQTVQTIDDPALNHLVGVLRVACRGTGADLPSLTEVIGQLEEIARYRPTRDQRSAPRRLPPEAPAASEERRQTESASAPPRHRRITRLNSFLLDGDEEAARQYWVESGLDQDPEAVAALGDRMAELERRHLLRRAREAAEVGETATLLRLWEEGDFEHYPPAAPLQALVVAARQRLGSASDLRAALHHGDVEAVMQLWPELRHEPAASAMAVQVHDLIASRANARLASALAHGNDAAILAAAEAGSAADVPLDAAARRATRAATDREETRRSLRAAIAVNDRLALTTLALSGRLSEIGHLEQSTTRAVLRALAWPQLERALTADTDAAIVVAADDDLFSDDDALSPEQRERIALARDRLASLASIRAALRQRDVGTLRRAVETAPPGTEARLSRVERRRIERLTARETAAERLATALQEGPDRAIVDALNAIEAAGAPLPEALDWTAIRGVVDRLTLSDAIREATAEDPPDYARLARLLPAARAAVAEGGEAGSDGFDIARLETDILSAAHLARLREALQAGDDDAIAAAAHPDPYGAVNHLPEEQRARVRRALSTRAAAMPAPGTRW